MEPKFNLQRIGKAIARQRKLSGLTQSEVAERLNLSKESVSRMETGVISPTLARMFQFCDLFQCTIGEFFWLEEEDEAKQVVIMMNLMRRLSPKQRRVIVDFVRDIVGTVDTLKTS